MNLTDNSTMSTNQGSSNCELSDLEEGSGSDDSDNKKRDDSFRVNIEAGAAVDRCVTAGGDARPTPSGDEEFAWNSVHFKDDRVSKRCHSQQERKHGYDKDGSDKSKNSSGLGRIEVNDTTMDDQRKIPDLARQQQNVKPERKKSRFFTDFSRRQLVSLFVLCLVEFSCFCSVSIMAPFFPMEAQDKGMSETTAGLVFSFYALVVFLSAPVLGKVLPQVGPKFMFLSGLFLTSSCNFLFGLLGFVRQEWVFAIYCFIVQGMKALGASAYNTATFVFVAEIFPANIGAILGTMETFVGLGMSIGPAIGGFLYHVGGFGLPFYTLGAVLLLIFPVAFWLLPSVDGSSLKRNSGLFSNMIREPSIIIIGLIVMANSNIWSFLDPTLEPHLREFDLTPEKIGFIFLLFSALYGLSSPLWGMVSDKTGNHWFMMTSGLLSSTIGLLILGPAPFLPFLKNEVWLKLIALSLLGLSVSLSILPTFQSLVECIVVGGHGKNDITTYSMVSGVWSSLYALGEVIGPLAGGVLAENYGFAFCCTVIAGVTFALSVGTFIFFFTRDCMNRRSKNYRYIFQVDSDGDYDSSDELLTQPILHLSCRQKISAHV